MLAGAASGGLLALAAPTIAVADVQLATIACSDGSQFDVSVDTDTLNVLTTAVTNLNGENLGLSCSLTVQPVISLGVIVGASSSPTQIYAVGGGSNDAETHFAFSAHVDPDTNAPMGTAVIAPANSAKQQGSVFCYNSFMTTRFAVVGIQVQNPDGSTTMEFFQTQDTGSASTSTPQVWQIDTDLTDCMTTFDNPPNNSIVQGNVVVRP